MRRKKIVSVDQNTGKILEGVIVYCGVKNNPYNTGWFMTSQDALETLASDEDISKEAFRILMFLMARLDFENWIQVTQKEICEKTNIKKSNVSRGISLLEKKGIILRGPKIGRSNAFRLNPYFGWKGKVKNLDEYRQKEDDQWLKKQKKEAFKLDKDT